MVGDLGSRMARHAAAGRTEMAVRWAAMFREAYLAVSPRRRLRMVRDEPALTGDPRWDSFLAGLVEDVCLAAGDQAPAWVFAPYRFLDTWWFVTHFESLHASAFAESPAAFANHGVFIHRRSLENV